VTQTEEKIQVAQKRIKELQLLIKYWKKQNGFS